MVKIFENPRYQAVLTFGHSLNYPIFAIRFLKHIYYYVSNPTNQG